MELDDTVCLAGLAEILEDEEELPVVELTVRCLGRTFKATVLAAEGEWTVNLRDERGKSCPGSGELYDTQADAILAAQLMALDLARRRIP
jgi:hypothetical protein